MPRYYKYTNPYMDPAYGRTEVDIKEGGLHASWDHPDPDVEKQLERMSNAGQLTMVADTLLVFPGGGHAYVSTDEKILHPFFTEVSVDDEDGKSWWDEKARIEAEKRIFMRLAEGLG